MTNNNPLSNFYRQYRKYVNLPSSSGDFLEKGTVEYNNERNEVGIKPMTAADEMMFKNPDALLNGEAITSVINSCVPDIKIPKKLLTNDINVLLVAIYAVSQGKNYDLKAICPKCEHENLFTLNLDDVLTQTETLDECYPVNLSNGLTVFVRPHTYEMTLKALALQFEESRFIEAVSAKESTLDEDQKLHIISNTIRKTSALNFDLVADSMIRVIKDSNDESKLDVSDRGFIKEFAANMELLDSKKISAEIKRINAIGLPDKHNAVCSECEHTWQAEVNFNPTDFFINT